MDLDHQLHIRLTKDEKKYYDEISGLLKMPLSKIVRMAVPHFIKSKEFKTLRKKIIEYSEAIYMQQQMDLMKMSLEMDKKISSFLYTFEKALLRCMKNDPNKLNAHIIDTINISVGNKQMEEGVQNLVKMLCPHRYKFCVAQYKKEMKELEKKRKVQMKLPKPPKREPATVLGDITRKYQEKKKSE